MSATDNPTTSSREKVSEILTLTDRVRVLSQSVDWWNNKMVWALVLAAIAALLVVLTTVMALRQSGRKDDVQSELIQAKDRQLAFDLRDSNEKIAEARRDASEANRGAADANAKAEVFRLNIAKANEAAEEARAQVAGATAEAAKANLELARIKAPRALSNISSLTESLKAYKGTEYTFSSVFGDEESILLLRQIDAVLSNSGWVRVKPPHAYPAINVYGQEQDFAVASGMTFGVKISVNSDIPLATLQAMPVDKLPAPTGAGVALAMALTGSLNPPQEGGIKANVEPGGSSPTVRIEVGRKP